jgi:hypothetical protein
MKLKSDKVTESKLGFILSLFLKYFLWILKIGLNFILFFVVDLPIAILVIPRASHYIDLCFLVIKDLFAEVGYWIARYRVVEEWIYGGYNAPEFENHYYQWRFFLVVRHYFFFALGIIFKIILGWILAIIHSIYWVLYINLVNYKRFFKKIYYNLEFIFWKIIYAFGVRLNLCINNTYKLSAFHKDFFHFDRKGWFYQGRDFIDIESQQLEEMYIPKKFRIKKEDDGVSEEKKYMFRRFLFNLNKQSNLKFSKKELRLLFKLIDNKVVQGEEMLLLDLYERLCKVVEYDYLEQQEFLLKKNKVYDTEGNLKKLTEKERKDMLVNIANAKKMVGNKKILLDLFYGFDVDSRMSETREAGKGNKILRDARDNFKEKQ